MGRILCAWSPRWAIDTWRRRHPCDSQARPFSAEVAAGSAQKMTSLKDSPFALIDSVRGVRVLTAVDQVAAAAGLRLGQKATDAMALCPDLETAPAEPEADAQALTELSDWCVRFSPAVALAPPDGLYLDVTGVAHLWGGEAGLMADLRARLARNGLTMRLAIADTPGAAWALAHYLSLIHI